MVRMVKPEIVCALLGPWLFIGPAQASPKKERYEISHSYETRSETEGEYGGSSSSNGRNVYILETDRRDDGCTERKFDAVDVPGQTRPLAAWKLPVRVSECPMGDPVLVNEDEMVARLESFLSAIEVTREACDRYYFTWNVFQIDCDPYAALDLLSHLDLGAMDLRDGAPFQLAENGGSATLVVGPKSGEGARSFYAEGIIDPEFLRMNAAKTEKVVRELSGETISIEEVLATIAGHEYSGRFSVVFEIEPNEGTITRTITSETRQVDAQGIVEIGWKREVTTRQRVKINTDPDPSNSDVSD